MRGAVLSSAGPVAGGSITVFRGDDALDAEEVEAFPIDPLGTFHLETARADRTFLEVRTGTHSTETVALVGPIPPADSE